MLLKNTVSLITGAGRGIGYEVAKRFALEGSSVILVDYDQSLGESAKRLKADLPKNMGVHHYFCDVGCENQVKQLQMKIKEELGCLDILINAAGITDDAFMTKMNVQQWDRVMAVNLRGPFLLSKEFSSLLERGDSSNRTSIVNISSIVGKVGNLGQANYSASKGGLISLTKTTAKEFAKYNIRCNAVMPGFIQTPMLDSVPEKVKKAIRQQIPLQQLGTPSDISNACVFLASNQANYITGTTIEVTGGLFC